MLRVLKEPCDACPFKGRFEGLRAGRIKDIIETCTAADSYFVCHKLVNYDDVDEGEELDTDALDGNGAICAGFLEAYKPTIVQVGERLGYIEYLDPPS